VDVYCPGKSKILSAAPGADTVAPTIKSLLNEEQGQDGGGRTRCIRNTLEALTCNANYTRRLCSYNEESISLN